MEDYIKELCDDLENNSEIKWVVYILRSTVNSDLMYCGMTNDIRRRLRQHNGIIKGGGKYTSTNRPWKLSLLIPVNSKPQALSVEYWTKAKNYKSQVDIPTDCPVKRRVYLVKTSMKKHDLNDLLTFDEQFKPYFVSYVE
jgi:putative endonuclease